MNINAFRSPGYFNPRHKTRKFLFSGASGTGKTTLAITEFLAADYDFKFVFDDEGQFALRTGAMPSFTEEQCARAIANGSVCFNPNEMFDESEDGFVWFCNWIFNFSSNYRGTKAAYFDEMQEYWPAEIAKRKPFGRLSGKGRNRGIDIFSISPSMGDLPPKLRGQITDIFAFQQTDEGFSEHIIKKGIPLDVLTNLRVVDKVSSEYLHWNKNTRGYTRGVIQLGSQ